MHQNSFWRSLDNGVFARLYCAQTINLLGDAFSWLGLALLAVELAGEQSPQVLATALTLRVTAFVLISPVAGVMADRCDRKIMMVIAQLGRMLLVGLLPFITQLWQVYVVVLGLNVLNACFTPTYKATIPLVTGQEHYGQAIALSGTTYQLLSMLGPSIAGFVAVWLGARQLFFIDAASFLMAALLISTLPSQLCVATSTSQTAERIWPDVQAGTWHLLGDGLLRYALVLQLVVAIAGAQILVNTVGYANNTLHLGDAQYGWVMAALGSGATLATIFIGWLGQHQSRPRSISAGAMLVTLAIVPAGFVGWLPLIVLWSIAGMGQSLVDLTMQMLIADRVPLEFQGRVYGAHFAWSHLWWAMAYPLAGLLGTQFGNHTFLYGGLMGLSLLAIIQFCLAPRFQVVQSVVSVGHSHKHAHPAMTHQHEHWHDEHHHHAHYWRWSTQEPHTHFHHHQPTIHSHPHMHEIHHHHEHSF